jgi:hypothetical protein
LTQNKIIMAIITFSQGCQTDVTCPFCIGHHVGIYPDMSVASIKTDAWKSLLPPWASPVMIGDWKFLTKIFLVCHYGLVIYIREYLKEKNIYGNFNISPYKNIIFKKNPLKETKFLQDITTLSLIPSFNISQNINFQKSSSKNRLIGSKQHITSQCVYFAFRTIILFGVLFSKKHVFLKRNFQMKCFESFYILYLYLTQCQFFLQSNLEK